MQAHGRLASLAVKVCGYRTEKKRDQKLHFMQFVPKPTMLNNDCNKDDNDGGGGNGDPAGDPNEQSICKAPWFSVGVPSNTLTMPPTGKLEKDPTLLMDPQSLKTCLMLSEQDVVKY